MARSTSYRGSGKGRRRVPVGAGAAAGRCPSCRRHWSDRTAREGRCPDCMAPLIDTSTMQGRVAYERERNALLDEGRAMVPPTEVERARRREARRREASPERNDSGAIGR